MAVPESERRRGTWLVLIMASIGMTVIPYNTTAVITIMPNLQAEFDLRPTTLQWVMTIYTISGASLVPIMGRLADLVGRMRIYILGAVVFALGALAVTLSQGPYVLAGIYGAPPLRVAMGATLPVGDVFRRRLGAETVFFSFATADEDYHAPNEFFRLSSFRKGLVAWTRALAALADPRFARRVP